METHKDQNGNANVKRILVAHKESTLEKYKNSTDSHLRKVAELDSKSDGRLSDAARSHKQTLDSVTAHLEALELEVDVKHRGMIKSIQDYDLVISVGGDGTVLDLSHKVLDTPILGVNSDPRNSVGYFCGASKDNFAEKLDAVFNGRQTFDLARFQVLKNGKKIGAPVLNDILVSHVNPAAVSSYVLSVGMAPSEVQKSSGIWISTAAGSTAAIRSAGGYIMPLKSEAIQYLVREPYPKPEYAYKLKKGMVEINQPFEVKSRMPNGRIYIDGPHLVEHFSVDDVLTIDRNVPALRLFFIGDKPRT